MSCSSNTKTLNGVKNNSAKAEVISVKTNGKANNYTFTVGIKSPDLGCKQYTNWWEVLTPEGKLLYRRILFHSHVNEQPFVRSGGKVSISANQIVIIRAHINTLGYGLKGFKGSVKNGFKSVELVKDFAKELEKQAPLPSGCAF